MLLSMKVDDHGVQGFSLDETRHIFHRTGSEGLRPPMEWRRRWRRVVLLQAGALTRFEDPIADRPRDLLPLPGSVGSTSEKALDVVFALPGR